MTSAQHKRWLTIAAWFAFVLMVGIVAYLALAACDLGVRPLFGLSYCRAEASISGLAAEQERERNLLDRLHQAQLDVARLPLVNSEEFTAGGLDTVRGYLESEVLSDNGIIGSLELLEVRLR